LYYIRNSAKTVESKEIIFGTQTLLTERKEIYFSFSEY